MARLRRVVQAKDSRMTWLIDKGRRLGVDLLNTEPNHHEHAGQVAQAVQSGAHPPEVSTATYLFDPICTICCHFSKWQVPHHALHKGCGDMSARKFSVVPDFGIAIVPIGMQLPIDDVIIQLCLCTPYAD